MNVNLNDKKKIFLMIKITLNNQITIMNDWEELGQEKTWPSIFSSVYTIPLTIQDLEN